MTEETPKKPRRKRRTKAEIEAEKAAKAAAAAKVKEMEAAGFEHVRARDEHGHFIADDPSTPENEAWNWVKTEDNGRFSDPSSFAEEDAKEELVASVGRTVYDEPQTTPPTYANPNMERISNRFKRNRANRRSQLK